MECLGNKKDALKKKKKAVELGKSKRWGGKILKCIQLLDALYRNNWKHKTLREFYEKPPQLSSQQSRSRTGK